MSYRREQAKLIQTHLLNKYGYEFPIEEILSYKNSEYVGLYHDYLADNKLNRFYRSLDEAGEHPVDTIIFIREHKRSLQYIYNGKWIYVGDMPDSTYD